MIWMNLVRSRSAEPEPQIFRWWGQSLKFGFRIHRDSLWCKRVIQIIQYFFWFFWTKLSRSRKVLDVGAGAKKIGARSWRRSLKFECRLHSLVTKRTYRHYHCSVTYLTQQWRCYVLNSTNGDVHGRSAA